MEIGIILGIAGLAVAILIAVLQWMGSRRKGSREAEPNLAFGQLRLFGPGEHPRENYPYAIAFQVLNTGTGAAVHPNFMLMLPDEDPEMFAEHVHTPALPPGSPPWIEFCGLRGRDQYDDVTGEEAERFLEHCVQLCHCWDAENRQWLFFPTMKIRLGKKDDVPWESPYEYLRDMGQWPSRGEDPPRFGLGPN